MSILSKLIKYNSTEILLNWLRFKFLNLCNRLYYLAGITNTQTKGNTLTSTHTHTRNHATTNLHLGNQDTRKKDCTTQNKRINILIEVWPAIRPFLILGRQITDIEIINNYLKNNY